jgi:hypothetical protein
MPQLLGAPPIKLADINPRLFSELRYTKPFFKLIILAVEYVAENFMNE